MEQNPRVVVLGEDVAHGSMLGLTLPASQDPVLAKRLLSTPLTTTSLLAHAGGLALGGKHPIVLLSGVTDLVDGLAGLRELGRYNWRGGETRACPMIVMVPVGCGLDANDDPEDAAESLLASLPGVDAMTIGRGEDTPALIDSALTHTDRTERPLLVFLPRALMLGAPGEHASPAPLSTISVHQVGAGATLFCWGASVEPALRAAQQMEEVGVVELLQLAPLDREAVLAHAQQSGRIVVAHAGRPDQGLGAELAALFANEAILQLDAPVRRVSGPASGVLPTEFQQTTPSATSIAQALEETLHY